MTRPIVWAVAVLGAMGLAGQYAGDKLATLSRSGPRGGASGAPAASVADVAPPLAGPRRLVLQSDLSGHYLVHPSVEGARVQMLVDTGATLVVLTERDAAAAGIRPAPSAYTGRSQTANGVAAFAPVRIRELRLGDLIVRDVDAAVSRGDALGTSLLGMSFLRRLRSFDMSGGRLTLAN
ncbi:MAG: TIGR02281 family clan AA aspartic protease [Methylobacteriaceae bacterium]|nr:TIGR02281 family clan AA aspartic protease [Methylobacteriaceae bacterium]